jgi:hypothetical protein
MKSITVNTKGLQMPLCRSMSAGIYAVYPFVSARKMNISWSSSAHKVENTTATSNSARPVKIQGTVMPSALAEDVCSILLLSVELARIDVLFPGGQKKTSKLTPGAEVKVEYLSS